MMTKEIKMTVQYQQYNEDIVVPSCWSIQRLIEELGNLFKNSLTYVTLRSETKEMILDDLDKTLEEYRLSQGEYVKVLEEMSNEETKLSI